MSELTSTNRIAADLAVDLPDGGRLSYGHGLDHEAAAKGAPRLRLRKLVVQGFKSFADKTEFVFDRPIVGVVGPNGCGKSNVVDAVKWVLGEQSAKSLRGEAMLDVIFNGAAGRQPGSFAEVTLVFENPADDQAHRPLAVDADEVAVGRQLLRDGTSHYKLNGKNARLKDVRDLFLDTGVGVDAYSVIEQGRVAQMLDASSAERRTIFEEAAGISRFKVKKKEAQRKLERVDQNLLRLTDIVEEVERRLRSVKVAAGKARNYQELSAQLVELRLKSALHDYHTLLTRQTELISQRDDAQFDLDDVAGALQRAQNALAQRRHDAERVGEARQQAEYALVQTRSRIEQAQQRYEYAVRQLQQVEQQARALDDEQAEAERSRAENAAALEHDQTSLTRATTALEESRRAIEAKQAEFGAAQLEQAEVARSIEQLKSQVLRAMNEIATAERRLSNLEIEQQTVAERIDKLHERRELVATELTAAEERRGELRRRVDELDVQASAEQAALGTKRDEAADHGQSVSEIGEALVAAREHKSALISRQKVLQDLEARREGLGEGVKHVLRERESTYPFILGLVADLLQVDVEHAPVIEAALDGRDQWLIADPAADLAAFRGQLASLPGRVNALRRSPGFAPATLAKPESGADGSIRSRTSSSLGDAPEPNPVELSPRQISDLAQQLTADRFDWTRYGVPVRLAVDLVQCEPQDRALASLLLGKTVVVASMGDAMHLHRTGPPGIRYVTHDGEVVEADGTFRAGPLGASMSILSRRSELAALVHQLEEAERQLARLQAELARGNEHSRRLDSELNAIRERLYDLNAAKVELGGKLAGEDDRVAAYLREAPSVEAELSEMVGKRDRLAAEQAHLHENRHRMQAEQAQRENDAAELARSQPTLALRISSASEALTAARVALGQVQEQQIAARRGVERHTARDRELAQQIERVLASSAALGERRDAAEQDRQSAEAERQRQSAEARHLSERVDDLAASLDAARAAVGELAAAVDEAREKHDAAESSVREAATSLAELAVRLETLVQRSAEEANLDLPAQYASLHGGGGGYQPSEDADWPAIAEQMKELRGRIQRLGNVNLDAIAEQEELEGRQSTLADQLKDLSDGKRQLEDLIDTINRESGERFEQTFHAVREHFQTLFRKLFGGGRADIFLQTEIEEKHRTDDGKLVPVMRKLDPLEAGIEIVARPPGKQPVTISQLSGGEKTMTCVALLMSIFKSKPSPFCILDEVDAALDEANNVRFNRIVEEFLGESQFIIITHSKRTMQVADLLYGVTMQEQGVSKKVAVRFDQVGEGGRIRGEAAA